MKDHNGNGYASSGGPWWAKWTAMIGLPSFLLAYLLGAIPGLQSPLFPIWEVKAAMAAHRVETRRLIEVYALTCQGVWRGNTDRQAECEKAARGILRDQETP